MLFNWKFAFCQFSMLFNGNFRLEKLWGGTYGRMYGCMEIHPCPTGHRPFGAAAQKGRRRMKERKEGRRREEGGKKRRGKEDIGHKGRGGGGGGG